MDGYLGWFDDTRNVSVVRRIADAIERYRAKTGKEPREVLTSAQDAAACGAESVAGVRVVAVEYVRPNHYWVGQGA